MNNKGSVKISQGVLVMMSNATVHLRSASTANAYWRVSYVAQLCASLDRSVLTQTKDSVKISQEALVMMSSVTAYLKSASTANVSWKVSFVAQLCASLAKSALMSSRGSVKTSQTMPATVLNVMVCSRFVLPANVYLRAWFAELWSA